jgi:hypothetical protein
MMKFPAMMTRLLVLMRMAGLPPGRLALTARGAVPGAVSGWFQAV